MAWNHPQICMQSCSLVEHAGIRTIRTAVNCAENDSLCHNIIVALWVVDDSSMLSSAAAAATTVLLFVITRSLAIAKRPCDCCIILKSASYTEAI